MENTKIASTREALVHDTDTLKRNVSQVAQDVKNHATAHVDYVKEKASDSVQRVTEYARENPLHLIAGAFALGLFIGYTRRK